MSNEELLIRIEALETFIKNMGNSASIPAEIDQAFRDRFFRGNLVGNGTGSAAATTNYLAFPVTVPANPSGTVKVSFGGVDYELLYK